MQSPRFDSSRNWPMRSSLAVFFAVIVALLASLPQATRCDAQSAPGTQHPGLNSLPQPIGLPVNGSEFPGGNTIQNDRLLRALNEDRQKSMVSDANKLLRLANELSAEIGSTNPQELTPSEVHKLAEIEKLAHNVKDKMSTSVRGTPAFQPPFQPAHY